MQILLNKDRIEDYSLFLKIKRLPRFSFTGTIAEFPDEYAHLLGMKQENGRKFSYDPGPFLFDYQKDISRLAIRKQKFAAFVEPGLGKTLIMTEFARYATDRLSRDRAFLIVSPLMVIPQTLGEIQRFYQGEFQIDHVRAAQLGDWLQKGKGRIGITNYEAITENIRTGRLGGLALDESSMLKSMYGKWGRRLIQIGKGLEWKICLTGTPAPNDRIEYGNHAVFLDQFPNLNAFLAKYFVNRGQTDNRWEIKPHALRPFYLDLSHWCIFLTNPATYGWKDNSDNIPPIRIHIHDVPLTGRQREMVTSLNGDLYGQPGGITSRAKLGQIAKGFYRGKTFPTHKPEYIKQLVNSWPEESTLVWCLFNREQAIMEKTFPDAASIKGDTPYDERLGLIDDFKTAGKRIMISKAKVLGFGLNLQVATRQVFSGLADSYESYFQAVKRSNRVGSVRPLNVHIPVTDVEVPMVETVLRKAKRVQADTEEQEQIFKECSYGYFG
jgi:hypothetical protein